MEIKLLQKAKFNQGGEYPSNNTLLWIGAFYWLSSIQCIEFLGKKSSLSAFQPISDIIKLLLLREQEEEPYLVQQGRKRPKNDLSTSHSISLGKEAHQSDFSFTTFLLSTISFQIVFSPKVELLLMHFLMSNLLSKQLHAYKWSSHSISSSKAKRGQEKAMQAIQL